MTLSLNATHPYNGLTEYDVHSLFGHKGDVPHAMGWWDHEIKAMFLCHFDKETMLVTKRILSGEELFTKYGKYNKFIRTKII